MFFFFWPTLTLHILTVSIIQFTIYYTYYTIVMEVIYKPNEY